MKCGLNLWAGIQVLDVHSFRNTGDEFRGNYRSELALEQRRSQGPAQFRASRREPADVELDPVRVLVHEVVVVRDLELLLGVFEPPGRVLAGANRARTSPDRQLACLCVSRHSPTHRKRRNQNRKYAFGAVGMT